MGVRWTYDGKPDGQRVTELELVAWFAVLAMVWSAC